MRCAEKVAAAYRLGQRDALADAVQRVEDMHDEHCAHGMGPHDLYELLISAIKGDQP